ncbi:hypothetical protein GCM10010390_58200 [Streptomyces mordarskii]|uniref:Transposase Helix-turn-helix domain-containing protein n=1 Tax=Streptomyces mordarskii TaxID=1226758 RepID=A0ABN1DNT8_9ACTN
MVCGAERSRAGGVGCESQGRDAPVIVYWRTNLTMRQLAPLFGFSRSAADHIVDHLGPALALQQRKRFGKDTVLIVDSAPAPRTGPRGCRANVVGRPILGR